MNFKSYTKAQDFIAENAPIWHSNETLNNLIIGLSKKVAEGLFDETQVKMLGIFDEQGNSLGGVIRTDSLRPVVFSNLSEKWSKSIANYLRQEAWDFREIVGPWGFVRAFGKEWELLNPHLKTKVLMEQGIYECKTLIHHPILKGYDLVKASVEHFQSAKKYYFDFVKESGISSLSDEELWNSATKFAKQGLVSNDLYFLVDAKFSASEALSMAGVTRRSPNGATIGYVYTPVSLRRRGYAATSVGLLTKQLLSQGIKFSNLYTDLNNPTSNSIYQKLGFEFQGRSLHLGFI